VELACTGLECGCQALYERAGIENAGAFSFEAPRCDRVVAAVFEQIEAFDQSRLPKPA